MPHQAAIGTAAHTHAGHHRRHAYTRASPPQGGRKGVEQSAASDFYIYTDVDFPYTGESFQNVIDTLVGGNVNVAAGV